MRSRLARLLAVCAALVVLALAASSAPAPAPARAHAPEPFALIVHSSNPQRTLSRARTAAFFLRKTELWPDGRSVSPVDLDVHSPLRSVFSRRVLGRSASAVRSYWNQRLFSGVSLPPPELPSEQHVVAFVARHRGAIGYVGPTAALRGVRTIVFRD